MPYTALISTGSYLPEKKIDNDQLTQFPSGATGLIQVKTGVVSRRHAGETECTSDLAIKASMACLSRTDLDPGHIDVIILATSSPDRIQPATATRVQKELGASKAFAFDINSVCTGGVYAIHMADMMIRAGAYTNILVVAAEVYSRFLNPQDIATYPYFGDGAGALLFQACEQSVGVLGSVLHSDGAGMDLIQVPAGGTMKPYDEMEKDTDRFFQMRGRDVYQFAVQKAPEVIVELLQNTRMDLSDVKCIVPHQANINIVKSIAQSLELDMDRFYTNLDRYGNTAAASPVIALDELQESGRLHSGDLIILVAFGGGLSWGANLISIR